MNTPPLPAIDVAALIERLRSLLADMPPGPYRWNGNGKNCDLYLATVGRGHEYIMGFDRWGMRGSQPRFRVGDRLVPASERLKFSVGTPDVTGMAEAKADDSVYRYDIDSVDAPAARLMVEALNALPTLLDTLERATPGSAIQGGEAEREQSRDAESPKASALDADRERIAALLDAYAAANGQALPDWIEGVHAAAAYVRGLDDAAKVADHIAACADGEGMSQDIVSARYYTASDVARDIRALAKPLTDQKAGS